jgi:hypothetical protein
MEKRGNALGVGAEGVALDIEVERGSLGVETEGIAPAGIELGVETEGIALYIEVERGFLGVEAEGIAPAPGGIELVAET